MSYCRIVDDVIVEYPVLEQHITNRGHRLDMYHLVKETPMPKYDDNTQTIGRYQ